MQLANDWREFIELLNANEVRYLIVGAFAVAFHDKPRMTGDIDFWVNPSPEIADRIMRALSDFGFGSLGPSSEDFTSKDSVVQLGFPPNRIDIMTAISGVQFVEAWAEKAGGTLDGVPVNFLSKQHLRIDKQSADRLKDRKDARRLK